MKLFGNIFTSLDEFNNELRRHGTKPKPGKRSQGNATVLGGREWVEHTEKRTENSRSWESKIAGEPYVRNPQLNEWDKAWLNEKFKDAKEGWNEGLAVVLKDFFAKEHPSKPGSYYSAADVEKAKRTVNGLEEGFSERNVKKYFWAFHRAMESIVAESFNEVQDGA